jgi:hypothetical protein
MKYVCTFCGKVKGHVLQYSGCGTIVCHACSKGGRSSAVGLVGRAVVGYATAGVSELARATHRKATQCCPACKGSRLIRI